MLLSKSCLKWEKTINATQPNKCVNVHHKVASNRKWKAVMGRGKGHIKEKGREDDKIIANILKSARTKECK